MRRQQVELVDRFHIEIRWEVELVQGLAERLAIGV
jgi:hypothetical protein